MTIRLLLPYDDYPIGARLSRDLVFETEMVAKNLATFDLTGSFQWPMESADEILGPFSSVATLEMAYPAYRYAGFTSLVGTSAPYAVYFSDGQAWLAKLGGKTNPLTGWSVISDSEGKPFSVLAPSFEPYKLAFWGDSRYNAVSTPGSIPAVIGSGINMSQYRAPMWVHAYMGDAEYYQTFAISGDSASLWTATSRSGREFSVLNKSDADAVFVQIGVNDIVSGYTVANTLAAIKALCIEILKSGKALVVESVMPVGSAFANAATVQANIDLLNAGIAELATGFPANQAIYVDSASALKDQTGYANPSYYQSDAIHPNRVGAQVQAKALAAGVRKLLPRRIGRRGTQRWGQNIISHTSPSPNNTQFNAVELGTATVSMSSGRDSRGQYYEWSWTPTALSSDECRVRCELAVNFQTAAQPAYSVSPGEVYQGSAGLVVDNGAGGVPNVYQVELRQRFYTGSTYNDWGGITAPSSTLDPDYTEPLDVVATTPRMAITAASVVANPAVSSGYALTAIVESRNVGLPVCVRMYEPSLRRVDYSKTPLSVTPPSSGAAYTNTSAVNQQVTVTGGTVSAINQNGVATGVTSGVFVLSPGDTLTPTYTVAPTMLVKHF